MNPLSLVGGSEKQKPVRKPNTLDLISLAKKAKVAVADTGLNPDKGTGKGLADSLRKMGIKEASPSPPAPSPLKGRGEGEVRFGQAVLKIAPPEPRRSLVRVMKDVDKEAGLDEDSRKTLRDWLMVRGVSPTSGGPMNKWPYQADTAAENLKVKNADVMEGLKQIRTTEGRARMLDELQAARNQRQDASFEMARATSMGQLPGTGKAQSEAAKRLAAITPDREARLEKETQDWVAKQDKEKNWAAQTYKLMDWAEKSAGDLAASPAMAALDTSPLGSLSKAVSAFAGMKGPKGLDAEGRKFVGAMGAGIGTYLPRLAADAAVFSDPNAPEVARRNATHGLAMALPDLIETLATGGLLGDMAKGGMAALKGLKGRGARKAAEGLVEGLGSASAKAGVGAAEEAAAPLVREVGTGVKGIEAPALATPNRLAGEPSPPAPSSSAKARGKEPLVIHIPKEKAGALADEAELLPDWVKIEEGAAKREAGSAMAEPSLPAPLPANKERGEAPLNVSRIQPEEPKPASRMTNETKAVEAEAETKRLAAEKINQERLNKTRPIDLKSLRKAWGELPKTVEDILPTVQEEAYRRVLEEAKTPGKRKGQWWNLDINSPKTDPFDDEFDAGAIIEARRKLGALSEEDFDEAGELKFEAVGDTFERLERVKQQVGEREMMNIPPDTSHLKDLLGMATDFEGPRTHYIQWNWNPRARSYQPDFRRSAPLVSYHAPDITPDLIEMLREATAEVDEKGVKYLSASETNAMRDPRGKTKLAQYYNVTGSRSASELFDENFDPSGHNKSWITVPRKAVRMVEDRLKEKIRNGAVRGRDAEDIIAERYGLTRKEIEGILSTPTERSYGEEVGDLVGDSQRDGPSGVGGEGERVAAPEAGSGKQEGLGEDPGPSDYVDPFADEEEEILRARAERAAAEKSAAKEPSPPAPLPASKERGEADSLPEKPGNLTRPDAQVQKADSGKAIYTTKGGKDVEVEVLQNFGNVSLVRFKNGKELRVQSSAIRGGESAFAKATADKPSPPAPSPSRGRGEGTAPKPEAAPVEPKKNPAIEKLRAAADRLEGMAEEVQTRDRKTNTAKRAREAGYAYEQAENDKALAKTMRRIADGLDSGELKALEVVQSKRDVERLRSMASDAKAEAERGLPYTEKLARDGQPFSTEHIQFIGSYWPTVGGRQINELAREVGKIRGGAKLRDKIGTDHALDGRWRLEGFTLDEIKEGLAFAKKHKLPDSVWKDIAERVASADARIRMGLNTEEGKRAVFEEWAKVVSPAQKMDPVKQAELALAGRKIPGYFPTPKATVERMVELADIEPGMTVLEPSAGKGNIADVLKEAGAKVEAVEPVTDLRTILEAKGHKLVGRDFLEVTTPYDRIVMNPPFENGQDMAHVRHAYDLLKPGGKVVSIMSEGPFFREDRAAREFRDWLESVGGISEKLLDKTFMDSERPTGVATRLVEIEKPSGVAPTADPGLTPRAEGLSPAIESVRRIDLTTPKIEASEPIPLSDLMPKTKAGEGWEKAQESLVKATQGADKAAAKAARAKLAAGDAFMKEHGVSIGDGVRVTYPNGKIQEGRLDYSPKRSAWTVGRDDLTPRTMSSIEKVEAAAPSPPALSPSERARGEAGSGKPERITDKVQAILKADEPDAFYRAQKGGETGVNDRWYKGGQFLPISVKGLEESLARAKRKAGVGRDGAIEIAGVWLKGLTGDDIPIVEVLREKGLGTPGHDYGPRFEEGWVNADPPLRPDGRQDRKAMDAAKEARTGRWTKVDDEWQWQVKNKGKEGTVWEVIAKDRTAEDRAEYAPWLERLNRGEDRIPAKEFPELVTVNNAWRTLDEEKPLTTQMKARLDEWIKELPENQQNAIKMLVDEEPGITKGEPSPPAPSPLGGRGEMSMADMLEPDFELRAQEGSGKRGAGSGKGPKPEEDDPNWRMRQEGLPGFGDQAGQFNLMDEPLLQGRKPGPKPKGAKPGMAPDDYITEVRDRASFADGLVKQFRHTPAESITLMKVVDERAKAQMRRRGIEPTKEALDDWYRGNFGWITRDGAMMEDLLTPAAKQEGKGAYLASADGRAIITAFEAADKSTLIHELGHHFRRTLEPDLQVRASRHYLPDGGDWDVAAEERFAQDLERYFYEGKAPTKGLEKVFETIKGWFRQVYKKLAGSGLEKGLDVKVRGLFDEMFGSEDPVLRAWDPGPDFPAGNKKGGKFRIPELGDEMVDLTPSEQARLGEIRKRGKVWEEAVLGKQDSAEDPDVFRHWDNEYRNRKDRLRRELDDFVGSTDAEQRKLDLMRIRELEDGRDPAFRSIDWESDEPSPPAPSPSRGRGDGGTLTPAPLPASKERGAGIGKPEARLKDGPGDLAAPLPADPAFKKEAMEVREKSTDFQVWKRSKLRFLKALTEESWKGALAELAGSPTDILRLGDVPGSAGREAGEKIMRDVERILNVTAGRTVQAMDYLLNPLKASYGKMWQLNPKAKADLENMAWKIHKASMEGLDMPQGLDAKQAKVHEAWTKLNGWLVKQGYELGAMVDRKVEGSIGEAVMGEDIWFYGREPFSGQLKELKGKAVGWKEDWLEVEVDGQRWWLDKYTPFSTKSLVGPEVFWPRRLKPEIKKALLKGKGLEYETILHWIALNNEGLIEGGKPVGEWADFLNDAQRQVTAAQLLEAKLAVRKVFGAKDSLAQAVGQGARIEKQRLPWAFPEDWYDYSFDVAQQHLQQGIKRLVKSEVWGQDGYKLYEELGKMSSPGYYATLVDDALGEEMAETPGQQLMKKMIALEAAWSTVTKLTGLGTTIKQLGQSAAGIGIHGVGPMAQAAADLTTDFVKGLKGESDGLAKKIHLSGAIESDLLEVVTMDQGSDVARHLTNLSMTVTGVKPLDQGLRYWTAQAGLIATDNHVQKLKLVDGSVVRDVHYRYLKDWVRMDDDAIARLAKERTLTAQDKVMAYHAGARTQVRVRKDDMPRLFQKYPALKILGRFQAFNIGQMRILGYAWGEMKQGNPAVLALLTTAYAGSGLITMELWRHSMAMLENKEPREVPEEWGWRLAYAIGQGGMLGLLGRPVEDLTDPENLTDASDDEKNYLWSWLKGQTGQAGKLNVPLLSDAQAGVQAIDEGARSGDWKAALGNMIRRQVVPINRLAKRGEPDRAFIESQRKKLRLKLKAERYTEDAMRAVLDQLFPLPTERKGQNARVQWDRDYYRFVQEGMSPAEAREELGPKPPIIGAQKARKESRWRVGDVDSSTVEKWGQKAGADKVKKAQGIFEEWSRKMAPAGGRR